MEFDHLMKFGRPIKNECILDELQQAKERCNLILECKNQINYWKAKLEVLEDEQATYIKLARLRIDAVSTWRSLTRRERMDKRFILAALESPELPSSLSEFASSSFPPHIRLDRDILLARVNRPDFGEDRCLFRHSKGSEGVDTSVIDRFFFVPPRLRSDKEVIMTIIPKYPNVIECMSSDLRDDEAILRTLLTTHPGSTLPSNFIQHFSDRIRCSAPIMLQIVLQHPHGLPALAYCGHDLRNDKNFFLEAIARGKISHFLESETQILRYASQRLRADRDIVDHAVAHSGLNLKHASYQLRRDKGIVLKACQQNGIAFRYCLPGDVKDELFEDRDFLLQVVSSLPNYVMKNCGHCYQTDRALLLKASIHGLDWDEIPIHFQSDRDFLCEMVRLAPRRYMDLPETTKEIVDVAFAVFQSINPSDDELLEATERCPQLLSKREAMFVIANKAGTDIISETLQFSPAHIRSDKEVMLQAIKVDPIAFEYCTDDLQADHDILMAALPYSLYLIHDSHQAENPSIAIVAIERTEPSDIWMTHDDISDALWSHRDVAKAWLAKGGDWLSDDFPEEFESDEELLLTVTQHNWSDFQHASESLKNNKEFLLRALAVDGRIIREISDDLRYDYEIALAAFGKEPRAVQFFSGAQDFEFMVSLAHWTRQQIEEHATFVKEVVANMAIPENNQCQLGVLNQGPELLKFYTETLVAFLGLPDRKRLELLEAVSKNLLAWGL